MDFSSGRIAHLTQLMTRRSRSGQSIILIAFAFIALIAFVGIATDVAMLFVRYSTLRRAVDAAAIAAAGQIRQDSNFMTLNATAKQFIQIHGIDPSKVKVETCDTEILDYIKANTSGGTAPSSSAALNALVNGTPASELCKQSPQKLIRVTAEVESPTAFLAIIGWRTVTLQTSSVAQTAVLDVAVVLDASLSEMQDTINHEAAKDASGNRIYPCAPDPSCAGSSDNSDALRSFKDFTNPSPTWNSSTLSVNTPLDPNWGLGLHPYDPTRTDPMAIRDECWMNPLPDQPYTAANYAWAGCCNDPSTQSDDIGSSGPTTGYYSDHAGGVGSGTLQAHQVLAPDGLTPGDNTILHGIGLPGQGVLTGYNPDPNWYVYDDESLAQSVIMTGGSNPYGKGAPAAKVLSGQPDGNKSDLICRPFKDVRDAARRFIKRLDFLRGDRVVLVTFDSGSRYIQPYGSAIPILTDKNTAVRTLNMQVGVEVNPVPMQGSGTCQSINALSSQYSKFQNPGDYPLKPPVPGTGTTSGGQYAAADYYMDANGGQKDVNKGLNMASYWTVSQCPDTNTGGGIQAANNALVNPNWIRRESVWVMIVLSDGYPNRTPAVGNAGIMSARRDSLQVEGLNSVSNPDYTMPNMAAPDPNKVAQYCNLYLTPMPPAAGGPPPTAGPTPTFELNPAYGQQPQWCITSAQADPAAKDYRYPRYAWGLTPSNGGTAQGSFGFCPWWTFCDLHPDDTGTHPYSDPYTRLSQCTENNAPGIWNTGGGQEPLDPFCTDTDPNARHSCIDGLGRVNPGSLDGVDPASYYCDPHYDATDYARDRADFAGLINYMDNASDGKPKKGNFISIYSIFFDHGGRDRALGPNILGVKFMRYLADVGDNGIVDNHLQRWYRDVRDGVISGGGWSNPPTGQDDQTAILPGGGTGSGKAGPAGGQLAPPSVDGSASLWTAAPYNYSSDEDPCAKFDYAEIHPSPGATPAPGSTQYEDAARQDCGQYFYADSPSKVTSAFIEIASRLFTRLSR